MAKPMTVKDLIASLQKFDGSLEVDISTQDGSSYSLFDDTNFEVIHTDKHNYLFIQ